MIELILETKGQTNETGVYGDDDAAVLVAPAVDEDYWTYRVRLLDDQSLLGFPKFGTIGIGFAVEEESWNTNLPYTSGAEKIFNHIKCNKGRYGISDDDVRSAIKLIIDAATKDRGAPA